MEPDKPICIREDLYPENPEKAGGCKWGEACIFGLPTTYSLIGVL